MTRAERVRDGATLLFDTNPIIYLLEGHALASVFRPLFEDVARGRIYAIVTPITIAEVLSGPLRHGREELAERYRAALCEGPGWQVRDLDGDAAVLAARLRARHRLKLPDAFQLAVALRSGCDALVTHDRDFGGVADLLVLDGR